MNGHIALKERPLSDQLERLTDEEWDALPGLLEEADDEPYVSVARIIHKLDRKVGWLLADWAVRDPAGWLIDSTETRRLVRNMISEVIIDPPSDRETANESVRRCAANVMPQRRELALTGENKLLERFPLLTEFIGLAFFVAMDGEDYSFSKNGWRRDVAFLRAQLH